LPAGPAPIVVSQAGWPDGGEVMTICFDCLNCGTKYDVDDGMAGKTILCRKCENRGTVRDPRVIARLQGKTTSGDSAPTRRMVLQVAGVVALPVVGWLLGTGTYFLVNRRSRRPDDGGPGGPGRGPRGGGPPGGGPPGGPGGGPPGANPPGALPPGFNPPPGGNPGGGGGKKGGQGPVS
jgi:hypothetical protein